MERRPVADTRRHGDDRFVRQAADDARERALHAGDDDDDPRRFDVRLMGKESVDASHAAVVVHLDCIAAEMCRETCFLRDGDVARAGRQDQDHALWIPHHGPLDV